mmetsp:Transcript_17912/g.29076  ORF Transcript_17912/g.29076 Transcript_17912/m.29076 type:complete len:84 (+) Transcript_17912:1125-1376(+)
MFWWFLFPIFSQIAMLPGASGKRLNVNLIGVALGSQVDGVRLRIGVLKLSCGVHFGGQRLAFVVRNMARLGLSVLCCTRVSRF